MDHRPLPYLLFVAGATHCALACRQVAKVTAVDDQPMGWLDPESLGLGSAAENPPARLLWLTQTSGNSALPIGGNCRLLLVPHEDVLPLPALHRRLTPFRALVQSAEGTALLLEPDALESPLSPPV